MATKEKSPGLFESARKLIYSGVRLTDDVASTARLMLIPLQAEAITEANDVLSEANMTLDTFKSAKEQLLA